MPETSQSTERHEEPKESSNTLSGKVMERMDAAGESDVRDDRHPVERLADEFSARWRAGETPTIEEYERIAPEHRAMIRSLFSTIAMIERTIRRETTKRRTRRPAISKHKVIGDFSIVREMGRGGMGIVFEAIQQSLKRRVALKVLGSGIANSPQQLLRFRREAESAARLHHTNIVPVYGIGEEGGIHFYAMQYIDGVPLDDAIATVRHRSSGTHDVIGLGSPQQTGVVASGSHETDEPIPPSSSFDDQTILMFDEPPSGSSVASPFSSEQLSSSSDPSRPSSPSGAANPSAFEDPDWAVPAPSFSPKPQKEATTTESVDACFGFFATNGTPDYFLRIAKLAAQVADALEYAHQHGVLHRDIKPSNLMIDHNGDVWIMDFGLVKILERQDLTQAGEIVGTLRYMAPEQLEGRADVTTDIYALGLTLYELLTLQPAFDGDETVTLAQRLRQSDIPRPRSINPAIPTDLETIVLKATAHDSQARYATAAMLADDLRRFCEDRPIQARRATYRERLWRWSRRNPALAAATGSTILLLGLVAAITTMGRLKVESALNKATASQKRAEANLDLAINAFDAIMKNVTSRGGSPSAMSPNLSETDISLPQAAFSKEDSLLLAELLNFYRSFTAQNASSTNLRLRTAEAYRSAGDILVRLGQLDDAEKDFNTAIVDFGRLLAADPGNVDIILKTASLYNDVGELRLRRGEFFETLNAHLESRAILLRQPDTIRNRPDVRYELARATDLFASIDIRSGTDEGPQMPPGGPSHRTPAERHHRMNRHLHPTTDAGLTHESQNGDAGHLEPEQAGPFGHDESVGDHPPAGGPDGRPPEQLSPRLAKAMPSAFGAGDHPPGVPGDPHERMDSLAATLVEASDEFRSLAKEFPENGDYQYRLAQCLRHQVVHAASNGKRDVARTAFYEAIEILNRLTTLSPDVQKYQFELAYTLTQATRVESESEAQEDLDRAVSIAEELTEKFPTACDSQLLLGTALARQAVIQEKAGRKEDAEMTLYQAIATLEPLTVRFPDQGVIQIPLAKTRQQLGDLMRSTSDDSDDPQQRLEQSNTVLHMGINQFEEYLKKSSTDGVGPSKGGFNSHTRSNLYLSLAETLMKLQRPEEAAAARKQAQRPSRPRRGPRSSSSAVDR